METTLSLRLATLEDAQILFEWRNDSLVRAASHNQDEVSFENHLSWLKKSLKNPTRELYIVEENGIRIGTIRSDWDDGAYTLSWTIDSEFRNKGFGKRMVCLLVKKIKVPLRAEVKVGNTPSIKIAEEVGLQLDYIKDGVMYFYRKASS